MTNNKKVGLQVLAVKFVWTWLDSRGKVRNPQPNRVLFFFNHDTYKLTVRDGKQRSKKKVSFFLPYHELELLDLPEKAGHLYRLIK